MSNAVLPPFDPQWLMIEQAMGGRRSLGAQPVEESRAGFNGIIAMLQPMLPPKTDAVITKDIRVPGKAGAIEVRVYTPTAAAAAAAAASVASKADGEQSKATLPVGLYIHSGGWYSGSIDAEDHLCRKIAADAGIILFSPNYRLAPENPFPAGLEDVCAVYEYVCDNTDYDVDSKVIGHPTKRLVMGGSAAANLAASVALKYASDDKRKPTGLIAACMTACDPAALPEEYKARYTPEMYSDSPMISNEIVTLAREWYAAPSDDPLHSPLLHENIKLLPRTYIAACTKDPTHQETVFFYEECKKQGVDVELEEWVGWPHFFWIVPVIPKSAEFLDTWVKKVRWMVDS